MNSFDWRADVSNWCKIHRKLPQEWEPILLDVFEKAFQNTLHPDRAWFGTHKNVASLVVGGIFLVACYRKKRQWAVSILADQEPPAIEGIAYSPVIAAYTSSHPVLWADTNSLQPLRNLLADDRFWTSFRSASAKILAASRIAGDRDKVQERRGKRRLSDFWGVVSANIFPDEILPTEIYREGAKITVTVNAYERDEKAREECLKHFGRRCSVCTISFGETYGSIAEQFIHVHHLRPLSEIGEEYTVNPLEDLRPVCPNCHAVLHLRKPKPFSIVELQELLGGRIVKAIAST